MHFRGIASGFRIPQENYVEKGRSVFGRNCKTLQVKGESEQSFGVMILFYKWGGGTARGITLIVSAACILFGLSKKTST